ncbi:hypothetical protein COU97_00905, partial [Candidatus Shapirobacteria bacterium CG10_big_fil_rev_8_21_14_0_10_48_15]
FFANTTDTFGTSCEVLGCFVCGGDNYDKRHTLTAKVENEATGMRISDVCFGQWGTKIREDNAGWTITVAACQKHLNALKKLRCLANDGYIAPSLVKALIAEHA